MLSEDQVIRINRRFTGHGQLLNPGLLGSAFSSLAYFEDPRLKASSVLVGLIKNHAFADGNKRTAFVAFNVIRMALGLPLSKTQDQLFAAVIHIATSRLSVVEVSNNWLFTEEFHFDL